MRERTDRRGQSGLDRLALFVVSLVAILLVAPTALGFAGVDVREPRSTDGPVAVELTVLGAEGTAVDANRTSVGAVRLVLTNTGGKDVDMAGFTATWVGNGTYALVPARAETGADGTFAIGRVGDETGTVLSEPGDRGVLTFDLGTDDVDGAGEFGGRLRPGETATVTVVARDGTTVTEEVTVPDPLPAGGSVGL